MKKSTLAFLILCVSTTCFGQASELVSAEKDKEFDSGSGITISLPGGISTVISGIGVYYPDGKETQRIGIVPDIEIKPTIDGIRKGQDELVMKAIEITENKQPIKADR